jgi:hypothetical protein
MVPVLFRYSSLIESANNSLQILSFLVKPDQDPKPGLNLKCKTFLLKTSVIDLQVKNLSYRERVLSKSKLSVILISFSLSSKVLKVAPSEPYLRFLCESVQPV